GVLAGHGVADRVGDIDGGGAGLDGLLDHLGQEIQLGAGGVLGGELDVGAVTLGALDALDGPADDFLLSHVQLEFAMDGAGGQEDMDAGPEGAAQGLAGPVDIFWVAAGQAADDRPVNLVGDGLHRLEIARRGDGEAGFDDVHAEILQRVGYLQLLSQIHAAARTLFAVPQGRVEYVYSVCLGAVGVHRTLLVW